MNTKRILVYGGIIVMVGLLFWIRFAPKTPSGVVSDFMNATYTLSSEKFTLINGVSVVKIAPDSASTVTTKYFGNEVHADLDGNGTEDVAFILTQNGGGSGTYYYVAAALKSADGYRGINGILLGDRIAPQTTEFKDGKLIVNFADRTKNEPMTATPSVGVSKTLTVTDGVLTEVTH